MIYHLIYNSNAARGTTKRLIPHIVTSLSSDGQNLELHETAYPHHATEITSTIFADTQTYIIAIGGDGTASEVMNGIMRNPQRENIVLGIIPCGTGNDFLKDYEIYTVEEALKRIQKNQPSTLDIGKITWLDSPNIEPVYFMNIFGTGVIAEGARLRRDVYSWAGKCGYHFAFVHMLPGLREQAVTLQMDGGEKINPKISVLSVCNSQYTGNGMRISPVSSTSDGKLDLLYTENLSRWELLKLFVSLPSGKHLQHPKIRHIPFKKMVLEMDKEQYVMMDGEVKRGRSIEIEILPRMVQFLS